MTPKVRGRSVLYNLGLVAMGVFAGFFSAAFGVGGGVIIVPALVLLFGFRMHKAVGTSLATIVPGAVVGLLSHIAIESGHTKWLIVLLLCLGSLPGAKLGAVIAKKLSGTILRRLFAAMILVVGLEYLGLLDLPTEPVAGSAFYPLLVLVGLLAGSGASLFGIGGGLIIVPAVNLFFGLTIHEAIPTSLAVIVPTTAAGALFHGKLENIDRRAMLCMVPALLAGAVLGAILANSLRADSLMLLFGILLCIVSVRMFSMRRPAKPAEAGASDPEAEPSRGGAGRRRVPNAESTRHSTR